MSARAAALAFGALALVVLWAAPATALAANAIRTPANYASNAIPRGDDTYSSVVALPLTMNWNGTVYNTIYINMNGNCTFGNFSALYDPTTPMATTNRDMLAPFWADVDTRVGGGSSQMTYSDITGGNVPQIDGHNAFIVNWINVGRYNASGPLNSFQLVLIDRSDTGAGNFDIEYNYNSILWDRGTAASNFYARAGWSRTGNVGYEITGGNNTGHYLDTGADALVDGSLNSGGVLGRYVWSVRNGVPPNSPPVITLGFASANSEANGPTGLTGYSGAGDATAVDNDGSIASLVRSPAAGTFLPNGINTVTWTATDNLGAVTVATQTINVVDTTPPTLPATLWSSSHALSTWSKLAAIVMNWTSSTDAANGVAGYSFDFTANAAGLPDTTVDSFITVGAVNDTVESQTFPSNTWPGDWTRPAGDSQTYLRANNAALRNHGTSAAEVRSDGNRRTVQFDKTYDLSGYTAATLSFWDYSVQCEAPDFNTVEYSTNGSTWTNLQTRNGNAGWTQRTYALPTGGGASTVTVRFSGSVNVNNEYVCWDDILLTASAPAHNTTTQAPGDGRWYFNVRALDGGGNWTPGAASLGPFWIDTAPPVTSSNISADWVNVAPMVTLTAADPLSGSAGTMYRVDGGGWTSYAAPFLYATDGTHVFDFYSTDAAGNVESPERTSTLRLDRVDPTTPTGLTATAAAGAVSLNWNAASDVLSGLKEYRIYRNGSLVGASTTTSFSDTVPSEGTYSYTIAAVDNAGNVGTQSTAAVLFVDTTPPTLPVLTSPTHPLVNHWYGPGPVTLDWTNATDVSSGSGGYSYSWTPDVAGLPDTTTDSFTPGTPTIATVDHQTFDSPAPAWPADWTRTNTTYVRTSAGGARAQGTYSAEMSSDVNGTRRTASFQKVYDLSGCSASTISYWMQLAGSSGTDFSRVEYSTDGATWIRPITDHTTSAAGALHSFALPVGATVYVRFTGSVNQTTEYVDWDNILVTGTVPGLNSAAVNPGQGMWHFNLRAVDGAGNWTPGAADLGQIWIDTDPPVTTSNISAAWVSVAPTVTFTRTDLFSGGASTSYRVDGGGWTSYAAPFLYATEGTHEFEFYSTDAVGNVESPAKTSTLRLDLAPPTVPTGVTASPVDTRTADVAWTASADALSGVAYYSVYIDGSLAATTTALSYTASGLTPGQTYSFGISATDSASSASAQSAPVTIDMPQATLWITVSQPTVAFPSMVPGLPTTLTDATTVSVNGVGAVDYDLSCSGSDFTDTGTGTLTFPVGSLEFITKGWCALSQRPLTTSAVPLDSSSGVAHLWRHDYTFDYVLNVPWSATPADYATNVVYTVVLR